MKIFLASDHAGVELKASLKSYLQSLSYEAIDLGPNSTASVDYSDYAHTLADRLSRKPGLGILICGSGNGVCMTANKHQNIRAALVWNAEIATLAKQHNDSNVLCLPARYLSLEEGNNIVKAWLDATFEGGRHERRIQKIPIEAEVPEVKE